MMRPFRCVSLDYKVHDYTWPDLKDAWGFLRGYDPTRPDAGAKVWRVTGPGISVVLRFK